MGKNTVLMYIVVFLAGVLGGVLVPRSLYAGPAPTPTAHATAVTNPYIAADTQ
ncbi:MAG TPA: hypothetical protein VIY53_20460 [Acidobacteriaceae bacterium]